MGPTFTYYVGSDTGGTNLGSTAPIAVGTYTVVASFAGSADYASASSNPVTFTINQVTPTVVASDAGGAYSGSADPATASITGVGNQSTPTGSLESVSPTFTYYIGTDTTGVDLGSTAPATAGTYTVVASYAGSPDYTSASTDRRRLPSTRRR